MNTKLATFAVVAVLSASATSHADDKSAGTPASRAAATLQQIQGALGFVPSFVKAVPLTLLPTWWEMGMSFEDSPDTKLDMKTKQLIALAVAAQVPCEYCAYYHTEAARMAGATDEELREAVAMAAGVRQNSTILNGMQVDRAQFRKDVDRVFRAAKRAAAKK